MRSALYEFRVPFSPPPPDPVEMSMETIVEQSGWRSTERIVNELLRAGANLEAFRKGEFDFLNSDVPDDDSLDPVGMRGYDIDLTDISSAVEHQNQLRAAYLRAKEEKNAEMARRDAEGSELSDSAPAGSEPGSDQ